jgi:hypothetical protein
VIRKTLLSESRTRPIRSRRRGSLLPELAMSAVMLAIVMTLTVKVLGYAGQQQRSADHRQRAVLEVANVMERITASPFDEITAARARRVSISPAAAGSLSGSELAVDVTEEQPGPGRSAKRIAIRLRWKGRSGEWEAPVRLTTWIERRRPAT